MLCSSTMMTLVDLPVDLVFKIIEKANLLDKAALYGDAPLLTWLLKIHGWTQSNLMDALRICINNGNVVCCQLIVDATDATDVLRLSTSQFDALMRDAIEAGQTGVMKLLKPKCRYSTDAIKRMVLTQLTTLMRPTGTGLGSDGCKFDRLLSMFSESDPFLNTVWMTIGETWRVRHKLRFNDENYKSYPIDKVIDDLIIAKFLALSSASILQHGVLFHFMKFSCENERIEICGKIKRDLFDDVWLEQYAKMHISEFIKNTNWVDWEFNFVLLEYAMSKASIASNESKQGWVDLLSGLFKSIDVEVKKYTLHCPPVYIKIRNALAEFVHA